MAFATRYLGVVDYGKLSLAQSLTLFVSPLADVGLSILIIREVARNPNLTNQYLTNAFLLKLPLSIISFGVTFALIHFMGYSADVDMATYLISASVILSSFSQILRSVFRAFEKMEFEGLLNITKSILNTSIGIFVLLSGYGLIPFALVYLIVGVIDVIISTIVTMRKFGKPHLAFDFKFCKQILALSFPFFLTTVIAVLFFRIDVIMLARFKGDDVAGFFNAVINLVVPATFISDALVYAIYPLMSKSFVSLTSNLQFIVKKASTYLLLIGLPISVGTVFLADRIVIFLYGVDFAPSAVALRILAIYLPLKFVSQVLGWTLSSINHEPLRTISAGFAVVLNIGLNLILIPHWGLPGAAISTVCTQLFLFVMYLYFATRHLGFLKPTRVLGKIFLASLIMGLFIYLAHSLNFIVLIIISITLYLLLLFVFRIFDPEDKKIIRDSLGIFPIKLHSKVK
jgi:O-antigen/teichoic acid export membrane protein